MRRFLSVFIGLFVAAIVYFTLIRGAESEMPPTAVAEHPSEPEMAVKASSQGSGSIEESACGCASCKPGAPVEDPVVTGDSVDLDSWLAALEVSASKNNGQFSHRLPDGRALSGRLVDYGGENVIEGRFDMPVPGRFLFSRDPQTGQIDGGLLHAEDHSFAYKVIPGTQNESAQLVPAQMPELMCINGDGKGLPVPPEEHARILLPPEEHPSGDDVPDYQNGIISLQSRPGAPNVIYIDFDGEQGPFPFWGDFNAAPARLSKNQIINIWRGVAEDYLPFNVNVTTDLQVYQAADINKRMQCIVTATRNDENRLNNAGGVALIGSFTWSSDQVCWARDTAGANGAVIISHEIGHTLSLAHDGNTWAEYEDGYGSGSESWGPIMGAPYGRSLMQWSKGGYANASNTSQDDIAIIIDRIGAVPDEVGDVIAEARPLRVLSDGTVDDAHIIESSSDLDTFHFRTAGGDVEIKAECAITSPNMNMQLLVYDANATQLFSYNHPDYKNVTYTDNLPAGDYYIKVGGAARSGSDSFPAYGSIGAFKLVGTINNPVAPQRFSIEEAAAPLTPVGTVVPWDDHGANPVTYAISAGNELGYFQIDAATGELTVAPGAYIQISDISTDWRFLAEIELTIAMTDTIDSGSNESRLVVVEVITPELGFGALMANSDFEDTTFDSGWQNSGLASMASSGLQSSPQAAQLDGLGVLAQQITSLTDFELTFIVKPDSGGATQTWQLDLARDPSGTASGQITETLEAVADTYIRAASNSDFYNKNYGNDPDNGGEILIGGNYGGDLRPMLRFDLSGTTVESGHTITSAKLNLSSFNSNASSGDLVTHVHLYPYDFVEGSGNGSAGGGNGATWNDPDGDDADVPGGLDTIAGGTLGTLLSTFNISSTPGGITFPSSSAFASAVDAALGGNLNLILDPDRFHASTTAGTETFVRLRSSESGNNVPVLEITKSTDPLTYTPVISLRGTSSGGIEVLNGTVWTSVPGSSGAFVSGQETRLAITLRKTASGDAYDLGWSDPGGFGYNNTATGIVQFVNAPDAGGIDMVAFVRDDNGYGTATVDQLGLEALPAMALVNGDFEKLPSLIYWHTEGAEAYGSFTESSTANALRFPWNVPSYAYQHIQPARDFTFETRIQVAGTANPALRFYLHGAGFGAGGGDTLIGLRVNTGGQLQVSIDGSWRSVLDNATSTPTSFSANTTYVVKVIGHNFGLPTAEWDLVWYPASNPGGLRAITGIPFFESQGAAVAGAGVEFVRFNQLGTSSHSYLVDDVSLVPVAEASPVADSHVDGLETQLLPFLQWAASYGISPLLGVDGINSIDSDEDGIGGLFEYIFGLSPDAGDVIGSRQSLHHDGTNMTFSILVRDDDPNLSISPMVIESLISSNGWTALDPSAELFPVDQTGVPAGLLRRVFDVPDGQTNQFLRIRGNFQ